MEWLNEVISKLERAGDILDSLKDEGADLLRKGGEILDLAADAARRAADVIDPTPGAPAISAADCEAGRQRLVAVKNRFEVFIGPQAKAVPWWDILAPLIISLIEKIIERRFPPPQPVGPGK